MKHEHSDKGDVQIKTPLWKWAVMALIIVAMPTYYLFFRDVQIEQAAAQMNDTAAPGKHKTAPPPH